MSKKNEDLKAIILKFIEEFEEQSTDSQLAELQKSMFLFQTVKEKDYLPFSIFNYGPYSFELERQLDSLLVDRSVERLGSKLRVTSSPARTEYDDTIKKLTALLKSFSPTDMQKACTVMYFCGKSSDKAEAVEKARSVSPRSETTEFESAFGFLSDKLKAMVAV